MEMGNIFVGSITHFTVLPSLVFKMPASPRKKDR